MLWISVFAYIHLSQTVSVFLSFVTAAEVKNLKKKTQQKPRAVNKEFLILCTWQEFQWHVLPGASVLSQELFLVSTSLNPNKLPGFLSPYVRPLSD